jgi:hypothetical protein
MKPILLLIPIALLVAVCGEGRTEQGEDRQRDYGVVVPTASQDQGSPDAAVDLTGPNSSFLVKLTNSINTKSDEGDPVAGVVIHPEPLRGTRVKGSVDEAAGPHLSFSFHTLHVGEKTWSIESEVTSVVNSKGNPGRDDLDQRVRVGGGIVAYGTETALNEGAEVRFVAWREED